MLLAPLFQVSALALFIKDVHELREATKDYVFLTKDTVQSMEALLSCAVGFAGELPVHVAPAKWVLE